MLNINRHNYEEYFLLYVDNELTAAEKKAVEEFVQQNSDLEEELVMLQQSILHPNKQVVFDNKEALLKNVPSGLINETNYQEYFVLYGDNELTNNEKDLTEQFVYKHPQYQEEFELIQQVKLIPDNSVVFPDKNFLYRSEESEKVVPFPWRKLAVAAVILLFMGGFGWFVANNKTPDPQAANQGNRNNNLAAVDSGKTNPADQSTQQEVMVKQQVEEKEKPTTNVAQTNTGTKKDDVAYTQKSNVQKSMAVNNNPEKNTGISNNPEVPNVSLVSSRPERTLTAKDVTGTLATITRPAEVNVAVTERDEQEAISNLNIPTTQIVYVDEQPEEEIYADNNSTGSKRPLRGFFRKVSRVFDKATNADVNETNKKGIRIASFEIALK